MKSLLTALLLLAPLCVQAQSSANYVDITPPKPGALSAAQLLALSASKQDLNGDSSGQHAAPPTAPSGSTSPTLSSALFRHSLTPDDYKLPADGANDGAAIQRAIGILCAQGTSGTLTFLARTYEIATAVSTTACSIDFEGKPWNEGLGTGGTWLHTSNPSVGFITISGLPARGSRVHNIGFSESQPVETTGWNPTVYPAAVNVVATGGEVSIENVLFDPVYDGIYASGAGRLELKGIYGQPLHRGMTLDQSYDTVHTSIIHFWPFWEDTPNIASWVQANGDAVDLQRVDGFVAPDLFVYGYHSALHIDSSASGIPSKFDIGSLYSDSTKYAVWITGGVNGTGLIPTGHIESLWADGELAGFGAGGGVPVPGGVGIFSDLASQFELNVTNASFERFQSYPVYIGNSTPNVASHLTFGTFRANYFNQLNNGSPAIFITYNGDSFGNGEPHHVLLQSNPYLTNANNAGYVNATNGDFRVPDPQVVISQSTSGSTAIIPNAVSRYLISNLSPGTLASLTVQLPGNPYDGKVQEIGAIVNVTALTITPGTGQTIIGTMPSAILASTNLRYQYSINLAAWVRLN